MLPPEFDEQAARRQLELVLASSGFARNERMSRFLRFVVERYVEGKDEELKESVIAMEVFGRSPDYNPRRDPIVRTEAARLRARLLEYYGGEGTGDAIVIELPKGGYSPTFRQPGPAAVAQPDVLRGTGSKRRWLTIAAAGFAVAIAGVGWWRIQLPNAPVSIAVLPLTNLSQDPAYDYFADGLTGELIRNLSIIDGLAVRSQTSSFALKGEPRNVREAGRQLAADYILEGSVLRAGEHLRINAQLVRVRDDFPLWSGRYDRELTDVLAIQDEISRGIVNSLRLKLGSGRRRYETSPEAYDLYLRARALILQLGLGGYNRSIAPFEEAIAKDPAFAPAYAGLAAAHAARSGQFAFNIGDEVAKMRATAEKAIQLDPLLAEAHDALGMAYSRDAQWAQSEKSFRRAIQLDPNRSESHSNFAMFLLWPLGRLEEAVKQLRVAEKADPLSPAVYLGLALVLNSAGRYDEAARYYGKQPEDYTGKTESTAWLLLHQGKTDEAIRFLETAFHKGVAPGAPVRGSLGCAYVRASRLEEAEKIAAESSFNPFNQARIFACMGDKDRTFEALDRAAAAGPFRIGRAISSQGYSLLQGDPRLKALRKKVGLPE